MRSSTIGIIGGAGPLAGSALLERILKKCQSRFGCFRDEDFPKIVLISYPFREMLEGAIDEEAIREQLACCLKQLRSLGATTLVIACNTLHTFLIGKEKSLIRLPESVAETVGNGKPLILCTSMSRRKKLYQDLFPCKYLAPRLQRELDEVILLILKGTEDSVVQHKLETLLSQVEESCIVLGCTELSLYSETLRKLGGRVIDPLDVVTEKILQNGEPI